MSMVFHLGRDVKEYNARHDQIIDKLIEDGRIRCEKCTEPMVRHSSYVRSVKETTQEIEYTVVYCKSCKKYPALIPDFMLRCKHYSGNEVESVILDSATIPVDRIDTKASERTVRRWIAQIGERVSGAVGMLKIAFMEVGRAISELSIVPGSAYSELEQVLDMAPSDAKYSGNKLGLANIWLGAFGRSSYI